MQLKKIFLYILSAALLLCGCTEISEVTEPAVEAVATVAEPEPYPVTVDKLVFNRSPERVASLSPAVTEMLFELGCGDKLVCRSSYCSYPEEAASIPEVGSGANPDIDSIISYKPDLLITQSPIANKDVSRLTSAGISLLTLPAPVSVDGLYENYEKLALIFAGSIDSSALAESTLAEFKGAVAAAKNSCESLVFIMDITSDGYLIAGGNSFAGDYISSYGDNIAADTTSFVMTAEELIEKDPQVIFFANPLSSEDIPPETADLLRAFSEGHVYVIDGTLMERPTSRLSGVTKKIAEKVRTDTGGAMPDGHAEIPETSASAEDVN